jgi:hypothetical protein
MKTEVYSWRLTPGRKARLERVARGRNLKIAQVLDIAVDEWLAKHPDELADDAEQKRLHTIAKRIIGSITSGNRHGSTSVRQTVRKRLAEKYGR